MAESIMLFLLGKKKTRTMSGGYNNTYTNSPACRENIASSQLSGSNQINVDEDIDLRGKMFYLLRKHR